MTTIFYENLPVAHLSFENGWISRRVSNLAERISAACEAVASDIAGMAGDPTRILERVTHSIQKRCKRIQS
ncbi:hypothetical protein [Rhizobium rhizoryzae]|uniref:hypothetical protein n=1 Tax=Rhizobium rhizoryzae TaxID=451876 RepID=UPI00289A04E7|nr:hypothetical protein [Rhizobium rhizoryzae]